MQNPSQQFIWFLVCRLEAIKKMRAELGCIEPLQFVYTDIAIQMLEGSTKEATRAALLLQPTATLVHRH